MFEDIETIITHFIHSDFKNSNDISVISGLSPLNLVKTNACSYNISPPIIARIIYEIGMNADKGLGPG